jgi:hypothetical protein
MLDRVDIWTSSRVQEDPRTNAMSVIGTRARSAHSGNSVHTTMGELGNRRSLVSLDGARWLPKQQHWVERGKNESLDDVLNGR